jgi:polyisoprenoid-binding protein YceI
VNWKHSLPYFSLFALLAFFISAANAQEHYRLDPASSQVHFSLEATGHAVEGTFNISSGDISFNASSGTISGKIAVDAASGNSNNKSRDKKMNADQLKVSDFPLISFAPLKYTGTLNPTGDSTIQVEGSFTLIGQEHALSVPMTIHREGNKCTANGSFSVPFISWGVKDPSIMFAKVGKEVKIDLKLNGTTGQ